VARLPLEVGGLPAKSSGFLAEDVQQDGLANPTESGRAVVSNRSVTRNFRVIAPRACASKGGKKGGGLLCGNTDHL